MKTSADGCVRRGWLSARRGGLAGVAAGLVAWLGVGEPVAMAQGLGNDFFIELKEIDRDGLVVLEGRIPPGFRHIVLEEYSDGGVPVEWEARVAGPTTGARAWVQFRVPLRGARQFFRIRAGADPKVPVATFSGPDALSVVYEDAGAFLNPGVELTHVLNRVAYGPSPEDFAVATILGPDGYIEQQLSPEGIDESGNVVLQESTDALFYEFLPGSGESLIVEGDQCRYFKGTSEPPVSWKQPGFNDSSWLQGPTGLGFGDGDDATLLDDMGGAGGYLSVYCRQTFTIDDLSSVDNVILRIWYDDGFVAYINGHEVARDNVQGSPPAFNAAATVAAGNVDGGGQFEFNITDLALPHLVQGVNVLAVQGHNAGTSSSDFSLIPGLALVPDAPYEAIRGKSELKQLLHVRGVHSRRQLQAVLGEFWENHFTTDYDKLYEYLLDLDAYRDVAGRSDADEAMIERQARIEASRMEWEEYEFFYQNGLGHFGDLLLYSATSPAMLIYLDSILNRKGAPNENYAREILELHAFGVDNRYTQADIEQLARCFTGWTIRKMRPADRPSYPDSARTPPTNGTRTVESDSAILDLGATWKYFKGTAEPTPGLANEPTTEWAQPEFDDGGWASGATGIGYGDGDDATVLADMAGGYLSVYARTDVVIPDLDSVGDVVIDLDYDDGFVLYLNGVELRRSGNMRGLGEPPPHNVGATYGHEANTGSPSVISLSQFRDLIAEGQPNTIAIQVHNTDLESSDLSVLPRVLVRTYTADSVDLTDPGALWTFRFNPSEHDTEAKVVFAGTPHEMTIPAGRQGLDGLLDATEVVDAMVGHPSTAEFICLKLVNRFVSDEISLDTYHDRSAPNYLLGLMDSAIQAWFSTPRPGHVATVLRTILDPTFKSSAFWTEGAFFTKVKSPIEFMNSAVRALGADLIDDDLIDWGSSMGQSFFDRDEPDGYPETGADWVDTLSLLERMRFNQALGQSLSSAATAWSADGFLADNGLSTLDEVLDYFDVLVFGGLLSPERRAVLREFADTDLSGNASPFDGLSGTQKRDRLEELIGLLLSLPEFQYQ